VAKARTVPVAISLWEARFAQGSDDQRPAQGEQAHEVPLLTEVGSAIPFHFDRVLLVETPSQVRIARMVNQRHMTKSQAVERIGSQTSSSSRRAQADLLVDGSQPIEQMFESVDRIYEELKTLAQGSSHSD